MVITPAAVAFCPGAPVLVPSVGVAPDGPLLSLRTTCARAVSGLLRAGPELVLVLAPDGRDVLDERAGASFAPWGVDLHVGARDASPSLSLPLAVGAWLLDDAGWEGPRRYVPAGSVVEDLPEPWSLLVVGDGSARRTEKAPGAFHPDAAVFDVSVGDALASGESKALAEIDAALGERVLAGGVPAWHAAASLVVGGTYDADLITDVAPYGVGYFVALWTAR